MTGTGFRLAFAGTPDLAATILQSLLDRGEHEVFHVITRPDQPAGRGRRMTSSAVKQVAVQHHLPLSQPDKVAAIDPDYLLTRADLLIVAAFGMILPASILNRPRLGCVNVHASLLPRWRGAAPVQRSVLAGDDHTGITIMQMDTGLDTGDILLQRSCPIQADDTTGTLLERLAELGAHSLHDALAGLGAGTLTSRPQDPALATYARKISRDEAEIDWRQPAAAIERCIRAFDPVPGARTELRGQAMRVCRAQVLPGTGADPGCLLACAKDTITVATGDGNLGLLEIQLPGKRRIRVSDFLNGHPEFRHA